MEITAIAAMDENRLIAGNGGLPGWDLPRDVRHFRQYTNGHFLLLGRTTFEEMTGWFDRQKPLVLTSREHYDAAPGQPVGSVQEAIDIAREAGEDNLVVGGGAGVYEAALPFLTQMEITRVHGQFEGEKYFPAWDAGEWQVVSSQKYPADPDHSHPFTMETWKRS